MHNLTAFIRFHATERPNDLAVVYEGARASPMPTSSTVHSPPGPGSAKRELKAMLSLWS